MVAGLMTAAVIDYAYWSGIRIFLYTMVWDVVSFIGLIRTILHFLYETFLDLVVNDVVVCL